MKILKQQRGFSLVEVVAAIVIVGIILISFSQLLIQSNKLAHTNTEKLVTVQLADGMLERLKASPSQNSEILKEKELFCPDDITAVKPDAQVISQISMNNKNYIVTYLVTQCDDLKKFNNASNTDLDLNLARVVVTVTAPDGKIRGSSEGYVTLE